MSESAEWTDPYPMHSAAQSGDVALLKRLIDQGHSVNTFDELGKSPLHYAASNEHLDAATILLQAGADVNANDDRIIGETPLGDIAGNCSFPMAKLLIDAGADPTIRGWMQNSALDRACKRKRGDGPKIYELLESARIKRRQPPWD